MLSVLTEPFKRMLNVTVSHIKVQPITQAFVEKNENILSMCWDQTASVSSINLQKLISTRAAHWKIVKGQLNTITENLYFEDISASLERPLGKIALLKQIN